MNKRDVAKMAIFLITLALLLIEHCTLELEGTLWLVIGWTILTLIALVRTLKDYAVCFVHTEVQTASFYEEDF